MTVVAFTTPLVVQPFDVADAALAASLSQAMLTIVEAITATDTVNATHRRPDTDFAFEVDARE